MSRTKLLIGCTVSVMAFIAIVAVVAVALVMWRVRSSPTRVARKSTPLGTPKGSPLTKTIGADGGSISSADGRITLTIPPHAVSNTTNFSIQPFTNTAPGGAGDAYQLEPSGANFSSKLKLSFKFSDADIAGTTPNNLAVVYEDNAAGAWHTIRKRDIDKQNKTCTVSIEHFSYYSLAKLDLPRVPKPSLSQLHIEPAVQTIRPGQSTYVEVVGCEQNEGLGKKISRFFLGDDAPRCEAGGGYVTLDWTTDLGNIENGNRKVKYTAPSKANPGDVAVVSLVWHSGDDSDEQAALPFHAFIHIDGSYKVSGQAGEMTFSGTVCSLTKPFKVNAIHPMIEFEINFTPSPILYDTGVAPTDTDYWNLRGDKDGSYRYETTRGRLHMSGEGTYFLAGSHPDGTVNLYIYGQSEAHSTLVGIGSSGNTFGDWDLVLTPLTSNECAGK